MKFVRTLAPLALAGSVAAAALVAASPSADALTSSLECDPQTVSHQNYAVCEILLAGSPSNSKWTYGTTYIAADDGLTNVRFACGATGSHFTVKATWTDNTGTARSGSSTGTCGGMAT